MIYYELKVESGDNVIEIAEAHTIYFAKVFLETTSENTKTKSNAMLARVIIKGDIKPSINDNVSNNDIIFRMACFMVVSSL